ncbi:MAG TPA: glycosyltransferase, partial [Polyangiaceae bacterium]|nr:glycosyltransferase [Polyangiaceae bacterium]
MVNCASLADEFAIPCEGALMRRGRFSTLARVPSAILLGGQPGVMPDTPRLIGSVAAQVLAHAMTEPGSLRFDVVVFVGRGRPAGMASAELGGIDQAIEELCRDWVAFGHRVRVFGDRPGMAEGGFDGVEWLDSEHFHDSSCDVLLTLTPTAVDPEHDIRARISLLWLDGSAAADDLTPALDRRLDGYVGRNAANVAGLRSRHPYVAAEKIFRLEAELPARRQLENLLARLVDGKRLDIVIFTGPGLERWNPHTLEASGMGGTETMAWELGRHLVSLGHRVRVFADSAGLEGVFEGVEWLDFRRFHTLGCDVLLTSRQPAAVDSAHAVKAKVRLLWVHEAHCGELLTPARDARIDAYLCLSAWHVGYFLRHYPWIDPRKVLQTRNGINVEDYAQSAEEGRDPLRAVYSSCPSRGLRVALDAWPRIKAAVAGASLHVYYGFENWERSARRNADGAALAAIAAMKQQIASTDGVVFHGRTPPAELAREFRISGLWAYPDWTHETSCITAMQAQAAGLGIVTSALAALNETVGDRGRLLAEEPHSQAYREAFTTATIAALKSPPTEAERT